MVVCDPPYADKQPLSLRLTGELPPLPVLAWFELSREFVARPPETASRSVAAEGAGSRAEAIVAARWCKMADISLDELIRKRGAAAKGR